VSRERRSMVEFVRGCLAARAFVPLLVLACLAVAPGCGGSKDGGAPAAAGGDPWFEEVGEAMGIDFVHHSGHRERFYMPEIMVGGVAVLDYDGDGDLDIYFIQSGDFNEGATDLPGNELWRNNGDGSFTNVTAEAGVGDRGYGSGVGCGDYDGDGDIDIYVTNVGPNVLYRNDGNGTFTDVTAEAGVGDPGWGTSCAFTDFDSDGDLDLYVMNYVVWSREREITCNTFWNKEQEDYCSPNSYEAPARDTLYRNEGNGKFTDVTLEAGLGEAFGNGLGVSCADFDGDDDIDLYAANDQVPNQIWINQGNGRFRDEALLRGCALDMEGKPEASMGIAAIDADLDGDLDLFMAHLAGETNTFYLNTDGYFEDTTARFGLAGPSLEFTGFGLGFHDFDHNGVLDLFIANGRVMARRDVYDPDDIYAEPNQLYRGNGDGTYQEIPPRGGTAKPLIETSRAAAFGDLDGDGDTDIVILNKDARAHVLRNRVGGRGNWIRFRVRNARGTDAISATVWIEAGGERQTRLVDPCYSYCASNDPRIHFGLGKTTRVDSVKVRWPHGGGEETFGPFEAGREYEIRQGKGR